MDSEETRAALLQAVEISVKELERTFCGEPLTPEVWQVRYLCDQLDHTLLYGLKHSNQGYWPFVKEFSHEETTREIISIPRVNTPLGYGRAWLLGALQSGLLVCYFQSFVHNLSLVKKFYNEIALLRDTLRLKVTIHYLSRLGNLKFSFVINDPSLDQSNFSSEVGKAAQRPPLFSWENNNLLSHKRFSHDCSFSSSDDGDRPPRSLTVEADIHTSLPLISSPSTFSLSDERPLPDGMEQPPDLDLDTELQEIQFEKDDLFEYLRGERFEVVELLARESLIKYAQALFEEENETFYKVFLSYHYSHESHHLSVIFLVLSSHRLLLLKTTDGFSLSFITSIPLLHIKLLAIAVDYQAIDVLWSAEPEVVPEVRYRPPRADAGGRPQSAADMRIRRGSSIKRRESLQLQRQKSEDGMRNVHLVMLSSEVCTSVVSHLEVALRRLGVKECHLPYIRMNCQPNTVNLKSCWKEVRHVLWASCEKFLSRELYERNANLARVLVSRLFYRNVPKKFQKGQNTILWRTARFELKGSLLEQYDLESDITPTAVYNLRDPHCSGIQLLMEDSKPFAFKIMFNSEPNLELAAESEFEFSEWLHSLLRSYRHLKGKRSATEGTCTGSSLCSVVLLSDRLLLSQSMGVRDTLQYDDISSIAWHHNAFLLETFRNNKAFTWLISFYGEAESNVFLSHLRNANKSLVFKRVHDPLMQGVCCEPQEKTFNMICSYAAKFCDVIA